MEARPVRWLIERLADSRCLGKSSLRRNRGAVASEGLEGRRDIDLGLFESTYESRLSGLSGDP